MREIIGQLATQGFLTVQPNRGAVVTKLSLEDVRVIYNILIRCESYAGALFTNRVQKSRIAKLENLHKKMQGKDVKLNYRAWLEMNDEFHRIIYEGCGSDILTDLIQHTRLRIYRFRVLRTEPSTIDSYNDQHGKIIAAIREGNGDLTEKLLGNHLESALRHRFEIIEEYSILL